MKHYALLAAAFLFAAFLAGADAAEVKEFKLGHNVNEENTWHLGAVKFAETVEEMSNGTMKIQIFPNAQLGDEMDVTRAVQQRICDFNISGGGLQSWAPYAGLVECPYTFADEAHIRKVADGELGKIIEQDIIDNAGLRPVTYFTRGPRKLTANTIVKTPADVNGQILRVPSSPLYVAAWEALGAKVTPMAFAEMFTALQQGTIHMQENPLAMIDSASLYEVQKYIMNTDHLVSYIYILMGEEQYQELTDEEKEIIAKAGKIAQDYEHEMFLADEDRLVRKMKDNGMEFIDVDYNAFRDVAVPAIEKTLSPEQADLYKKIVAAR